jgi:carbon-monoxide dehydrogenase large subunit
VDAPVFGTGPYAVSQPVTRTEDPRLLRGGGVYTDDRNLEGQAYAVFVRSPVAHGDLKAINIDAAKAAPGVLAVYTHADIEAAGFGTLPNNLPLKSRDGSPLIKPPRPILATGRVRNVGEPVVGVIAETLAQARDAAELVELDIVVLPANTDMDAAVAEGALQLHEDAPGNVCVDFQMGDAEATAAAFEAAAHVTSLRLENNQVFVSAMEPRAFIGDFDAAADRYIVYTGCQGVFGMRNILANQILKCEPEKVRVITGEVGGSFGMKAMPYNEYPVVLLAAKQLGRPVKWTADRSESMLADHMGRGSVYKGELALDAEGKFLAARVNGIANMGSYLTGTGPHCQTANVGKNLPCMYLTPAIDVNMRCAFTNTTYVGAYRGAGRPEGNYIMERLVDTAAREMGIDPIEIRRRNLVPTEAMPFTAASGQVYDSGDFPPMLDKAVAAADWNGFAGRKAESEAAGKKRGLGICAYVEVSAPAGKEMGGLRFGDDGRVTIVSGTQDYGQGHRATFAQILSARMGIPFDKIDLLQGDSDELIIGGGTGGSRSVIAEAGALYETAAAVIEKGRAVAGHVLEAAVEDVEFSDGEFRIAGTDRSVGIFELAQRAREIGGANGLPETLDTELVHDTAPSSFPNGVHVCEVEIDPDTGATRVDRYTVVDDFGTIVNPLLAEGQVHGGVVQGIGQALMEHIVYDDDGQLLTGSYMDYQLPRAVEVPDMVFDDHPVPATTNVIGAKGAGEAGCSGSLAAVMNAVVDALAEYGVTNIDMPATPHRVWQAIHGNAG